MIGEIIAVGEEVLSGDVVNTNAASVSRELAQIGVFCRYHSVVGDILEDIVKLLEIAVKRSKVIVLSGGLGPTEDDLTKESVAAFLGKDLVENDHMMNHVTTWFAKHNYVPTSNNFKQGMLIEGGQVLQNNNGTACGVYVEYKEAHIFLLPGPPRELMPMLKEEVLPKIKPLVSKVIQTKTYRMVNIGESTAVTILEDIMQASDQLIVAPYAKLREVHIKVTGIGESVEECNRLMNPIKDIILSRLGDHIYTEEDLNLEDVIVKKLNAIKDLGLPGTIGTAESCTGGMLGSMLVNVSGASNVFNNGVITYSNNSKNKILGVDEKTLNKYGAVSEEVADEMLFGLSDRFSADFAISITGIAGPGGGSEEKPVGLVYIGLKTPKGRKVFREQFSGNRLKIREQSAKTALVRLWQALKEF